MLEWNFYFIIIILSVMFCDSTVNSNHMILCHILFEYSIIEPLWFTLMIYIIISFAYLLFHFLSFLISHIFLLIHVQIIRSFHCRDFLRTYRLFSNSWYFLYSVRTLGNIFHRDLLVPHISFYGYWFNSRNISFDILYIFLRTYVHNLL